jgi:hypothetical protein
MLFGLILGYSLDADAREAAINQIILTVAITPRG